MEEKKFGIKYIPLSERFPHFIDDCYNNNIQWCKIDYIEQRIHYFLSFIANINRKEFACYCCLPHQSSAEYVVFINIDNGEQLMLLSTIKDNSFRWKSWKIVEWLKDDLLLLDVPDEDLRAISLKIPAGMHPA